jgi:hypothetical protein
MSELGSTKYHHCSNSNKFDFAEMALHDLPQANEMLARTSATYFGGKVIDIEALMNPIGPLSLPTARGPQPINGLYPV